MQKIFIEVELVEFYKRAEAGFISCLQKYDNEFLHDEISVPMSDIKLKRSNVKFVFSETSTDRYTVEVCFALWNKSNSIGRYIFYEDENGNVFDDSFILD